MYVAMSRWSWYHLEAVAENGTTAFLVLSGLYIPASNLKVCLYQVFICKIKYVYFEELVDISIYVSSNMKKKNIFTCRKQQQKRKLEIFAV